MSTLSVTDIPDVGRDESKVFDGASELQLDCMVEEGSGSTAMKHGGLLSLADLSRPDDFPAPPTQRLIPDRHKQPSAGGAERHQVGPWICRGHTRQLRWPASEEEEGACAEDAGQ
ncbi:hypothetical protein CgunFtcFv8_020983 [Champsocephalus gunnari]|uniref:Uncharacterized protein n=1 Tax=Champsocephalus gunnari TaxID=52237 RepID=A0AAN8E5N2_CHAGU|nr:hypothetical protein CgunFtcFv8_020983 [Champsocephalus gunnari]